MGTPRRSAHTPSDKRGRRLDHSGSALAGSASRQGHMLWTKGIVLHVIVIAGLFLMPGGCPPPDNGDTATLAVTVSGQGTVAKSPDGGIYDLNSTVTLTATASDGWTFDHWEGALTGSTNPATISVDADMQVTAVFAEIGNNAGVCTEWTQTDITVNTTIPAGCWLVNDDMYVRNNATLTISPGATLKFATGTWLGVQSSGILRAVGTAGSPIVLTGQNQTPGYWIGLRFQDSNSVDNNLQHVTVAYGGQSYASVATDLYIGGTSRVAISNCNLTDSDGLGFVFHDSPTITFDANTITRNKNGAGEVEPNLVGVLTTTSAYTGNTRNALLVRNGIVSVDETWASLGVDYVMADDLTVDKHMTISPGARLLFGTDSWLNVRSTGSLTAIGTPGSPIVLTGQNQMPGSWIGLRFQDSNSINNNLQYVTVELGGQSYASIAANICDGGTSRLQVQNCIIVDCPGWGIYKSVGATLIQSGNTFADNALGNVGP